MKMFLAVAGGLALATTMNADGAEPFKFDPATCGTYLVGIWKMQDTITPPDGTPSPGGSVRMVAFGADGNFVAKSESYAEGNPKPTETESTGQWTAGPGKGLQDCKLSWTLQDKSTFDDNYEVVGPDEMHDTRDNDRAWRQPKT